MKNTTTVPEITKGSQLHLTDLKSVPQLPHSIFPGDRLQKLWNYFVAIWWYSDEPRITEKKDRDGNWIYHVYDPLSHQHLMFDSEQEVRVWLEERYYE
ncbi:MULTISPECIES: hypothetical protein [Roseofilum]|uniref:hypothetical protein n=1 Tax=Roseofilum TaxID=1233426 RepID=UPI000B1C6B4B|nr:MULTISPECIES: hypothetical protein [Roseofilum]HBR00157.1 hypothetical protein [Cyanobacteria bacterium UBA11691]MBP0007264.1 hypothetical protein [Roseofilum sp. Belize Diploria]MBP0012507.1 hypothetical protein [Roseofilum sp. SID3]MBP0028442.1 hypothetical protein [Roseofilum sp. Guam]MBP0031658.1 hypothetical protein [Roseofilum sp. Belize BBD 4]